MEEKQFTSVKLFDCLNLPSVRLVRLAPSSELPAPPPACRWLSAAPRWLPPARRWLSPARRWLPPALLQGLEFKDI